MKSISIENEKSVYSLSGTDGIIQHIFNEIGYTNKIAVEIGVSGNNNTNTELNKIIAFIKKFTLIKTDEVKNKNMIYIGLTFNFKQRIEQHLDSKRFVGIKKKYGKKSLIIKQITKYMPVEEAGKRENILITKCNKKGYQVLNKKKGGDLGSIASKWTKEKVIESAKKFKTQKKWRAKAPAAYSTAKQKGYLKEAQQFLYVQREKIRY